MVEAAKDKFGTPIKVLGLACGPADELKHFNADRDVKIIATDISMDVLPVAKKQLTPGSEVFASDIANSPIRKNSVDAGLMINAWSYSPEKAFEVMYNALRPGAQCLVNLRIMSPERLRNFSENLAKFGAKLEEKSLKVSSKEIKVVVVDFSEFVDENGLADDKIRSLGQQINFYSDKDYEDLVREIGFKIVKKDKFRFTQKMDRVEYQHEVYILEKPL